MLFFCADTPSGPIRSCYNVTKISLKIGDIASFANAKTSFAQFFFLIQAFIHSIYIRTIRSWDLLSVLLKWFLGYLGRVTCSELSIYAQTNQETKCTKFNKGQLISKGLVGILNSSKNKRKNST